MKRTTLGVYTHTFAYAYDAVGNRLMQNDNGALMNYTYDNANRLTNVNAQVYTWDNNGNLLNDGTSAFTYDQANRLTVVSQQSTVNSFAYNGVSDRISQTVNSVLTRYALDLNAGLTQVLSDGTSTYLYGVGRIAQQQTNMQYFGADGLGSVRQMYNSSGQIIANHRYDPFGNVLSGAEGSARAVWALATMASPANGQTQRGWSICARDIMRQRRGGL